ncbi:hypothetical protein LB505_006019 [Fusarium chuoi]|nr:hypothetical protein LB505_006019 [Fusarium chuoi]
MPGQIRVALYHGTGRQSHAKHFRDNDIVMTTYQTLRSEWTNKGPLFTEQWIRVVLDEGQLKSSRPPVSSNHRGAGASPELR